MIIFRGIGLLQIRDIGIQERCSGKDLITIRRRNSLLVSIFMDKRV